MGFNTDDKTAPNTQQLYGNVGNYVADSLGAGANATSGTAKIALGGLAYPFAAASDAIKNGVAGVTGYDRPNADGDKDAATGLIQSGANDWRGVAGHVANTVGWSKSGGVDAPQAEYATAPAPGDYGGVPAQTTYTPGYAQTPEQLARDKFLAANGREGQTIQDVGNGIARVGNSSSKGGTLYTNVGTKDVTDPNKKVDVNTIDLKKDNESMARSNAIRQEMIDQKNWNEYGIAPQRMPGTGDPRQVLQTWAQQALQRGTPGDKAKVASAMLGLSQGGAQTDVARIQGQSHLQGIQAQHPPELVRSMVGMNDAHAALFGAQQAAAQQQKYDPKMMELYQNDIAGTKDEKLRALKQAQFDGLMGNYISTLNRTHPNGGQPQGGAVPPTAIAALRANPERAAEFEAKYGLPKGAAAQYLQQGVERHAEGGVVGFGVPAPAPIPPGGMTITGGIRGRSVEAFATGGPIPVAGRQIAGPGTGTSDSIPAVIDGDRQAALSSGEYVIPADIVLRKGTEFFDKLCGKHTNG